jgi:metallopeptidase MepB
MLENWVWVPEVLKRLGRHYSYLSEPYREFWRLCKNPSNEKVEDVEVKVEETIPDRLIIDLIKSKSVNGAVEMLKQVRLALFDLAIHTPRDHGMAKEMDISSLWNDMREEIVGLASSDHDLGGSRSAGQAGFPHIFRKYDAGYFAYPL